MDDRPIGSRVESFNQSLSRFHISCQLHPYTFSLHFTKEQHIQNIYEYLNAVLFLRRVVESAWSSQLFASCLWLWSQVFNLLREQRVLGAELNCQDKQVGLFIRGPEGLQNGAEIFGIYERRENQLYHLYNSTDLDYSSNSDRSDYRLCLSTDSEFVFRRFSSYDSIVSSIDYL